MALHACTWHCSLVHGCFCSQATLPYSQFLLECQLMGVISPYLPLQTCLHVQAPPICTAGCPCLHGWRGVSAGPLTDCVPPYKPRILFFYLDSLDKNAAALLLSFQLSHAHPCRALQTHHCPDQSTSQYPPLVTRGNCY